MEEKEEEWGGGEEGLIREKFERGPLCFFGHFGFFCRRARILHNFGAKFSVGGGEKKDRICMSKQL